jgi:hypothetical protein
MKAVVLSALLWASLSAPVQAQYPSTVGTQDVAAGPIWNNDDAQTKCPSTCNRRGMTWNGNWNTVEMGAMSVCSCNVSTPIIVPYPYYPGASPLMPGNSIPTSPGAPVLPPCRMQDPDVVLTPDGWSGPNCATTR